MKNGLDDYIIRNGVGSLITLVNETPEEERSSELHKLNVEFAYVRDISMIAQLPTAANPEIRLYRPTVWMNEVIANRKTTVVVNGKDRKLPAGRVWLEWPERLEVESLTYEPGKELLTR